MGWSNSEDFERHSASSASFDFTKAFKVIMKWVSLDVECKEAIRLWKK